MFYRNATLTVLALMLAAIWAGQAPYLHDFGEWLYQSRVLVLQWTDPEQVAGFVWAAYPVPNVLAVFILAVLGLFFPAFVAAKLFLSILLMGWYAVLQIFVRRVNLAAGSQSLLFVLFSLLALSNFFWTGFVGYQLALLFFVLFLTRFSSCIGALELMLFAVLIFFSHATVFLVFVMVVLLEMMITRKRSGWVLAMIPAGLLGVLFVVGRNLSGFSSPLADAAMAGWQEMVIYKLGYPLLAGPFKNLLGPDLASLFDDLPWLYWSGVFVNIFVVAGLGLFCVFALWKGRGLWRGRGAAFHVSDSRHSYQSLWIAGWLLSVVYLVAPYNFQGLINPAGRITIPLLLLSLLLASGTSARVYLGKLLQYVAPVTLVFTFITILSYLVLMHSTPPPQLAQGSQFEGQPPGESVLDFNAWVYQKARYRYFNYRIFGFAQRYEDIESERYKSLGFRTGLLVDYKEP